MKPKIRAFLPALILAAFCVVGLLLAPLPAVQSADPGSGAITPSGPPVTWNGTATGGASANESTCVDGVNCDTFTLNVSGTPADWVGKLISIKIEWTIPVNDYDLVVHKDSNTGPIVAEHGDGAPDVEETTAIDPSSTGTGVYTIRAIYFSVTPLVDQFRGSATVVPKPAGRAANYVKGGIAFSPNVTVKAPVARQDGEPSSRTDKFGNHYVSAIRGVPAGIDLWYFDLQPGSPTYDPKMRNPIYRGQPDSFTMDEATSVGGDGGGDVDLAVGFDNFTNNPFPALAYSSLVAANISTGRSLDLGQTYLLNPAGNVTGGLPGDDRQWLEFFGKDTVYLFYRTLAPAVSMIQRSTDGGLTYGPARTAGAIGQAGYIDVHQATGTVYVSGSTGQVCVGTPLLPNLEPLTYTCTQAASDPAGVANIFFVVKVADDGTPNGTAYVTYSNGKDIFLAHSTNKGATWSQPVRVSDGAETRTSLFPWLETGPTPGSVGVVWFGTTEATNNDNANWQVFYAQSFNATAAMPTFRQVVASDHFIHGSNISTGGTLGTANRNLIDYFQVSFDPTGAAVLSYTDDHNDFEGHTYVTRQTSGLGIKGGFVPAPIEGGVLPPPPAQPSGSDPQVTDFAQDTQIGLLGVAPLNDPLDILSVKYSCENPPSGLVIVATMKVSDISTVPPAANWRMNFTANAPFSTLNASGGYSNGLSDRGDQFWVRATTDPGTQGQTPLFSFGTAVRNSDGSITYTSRGAADSGFIDTINHTITVKVSASKLNPFVTKGPAFGNGTILTGLRGSTFTTDGLAKSDITRGGTQYAVQSCLPAPPPPPPPPPPNHDTVIKVTGDGNIIGKIVHFSFKADRTPSGHLNYQDKEQNIHLVSDRITYFAQNSANKVAFTGQGHIGSSAVMFTVEVEDNGELGTSDKFKIAITGAVNTAREGTLSKGNIRFHR